MSEPAVRLPDVTRHAILMARAMTLGLRAWSLYPPEHPALGLAVDRLLSATVEITRQGPLMLAVTPHALLVDGAALDTADPAVAECARILHEVDILQLSFVAPAPEQAIRTLLSALTLERVERRRRGGPAAIWAEHGDPSIVVEQIDYQELLEREADESPARRDALWQSIVRSIVAGRRTFTEAEQQRLLEISRDAWAIGELADECRGPYQSADGSPLLTTQAATVLAVYRHIAATVGVLEDERAGEVMGNFSLATSALDPALALEVLQMQDAADEAQPIMAALKQAFDDQQIAMLLARALAKAGGATNRLSQMLETLAPDGQRRERVLRLADKLLSERDFGATKPIIDIRASLEELMLKYDETPYVSAAYRQSMDAATGRASEMAIRDLPPEIGEWLETLGHHNVRDLSTQLLIDLLNIETSEERAAEIGDDMSTFAQELLMAGAYHEAHRMVAALRAAATRPQAIATAALQGARERVGQSPAMIDLVAALGELPPDEAARAAELCTAIGASCVPALMTAFSRGDSGAETARAQAIIISFGPEAIPALAQGIERHKPSIQRVLAQVLGAIGTAAAVPPLQALLRRSEPRVLPDVVRALAGIKDPSAARALHMVLRATAASARDAVVHALVTLRDARVVPMLMRILDESDVLGRDFDLVLDALGAVATFKDDRAIRPITAVAQKRRWLAPRRTRRVRERAVTALKLIGTPPAHEALETLARTGDRQLRRIVRAQRLAGAAA